jgi:hypothetical protein
MVNVNDLVAVFPPDGARTFVMDAVQLTIRPTRLPAGLSARPRPSAEGMATLKAEKRIVWRDGSPLAALDVEGFSQVHLAMGGGGNLSGTMKTNALRRTRQRLIAAGRYADAIAVPEARPDNFLDEAGFIGPVDAHEESLRDLWAILAEVRAVYRKGFEGIYGVPPGETSTTITQVELTWDRRCKVAQAAPTLWWPAWRDAFVGAGLGVDPEEERPRAWSRGSTEHRETFAVRGSAVLHASDVKGDGAKLYAKHYRLLRYESELTRERMTDVLGRPLRLDTMAALRSDLETLAVPRYARVLAAQESLTAKRVMNLPVLLRVFMDAGITRKVVPIFEALWSGATFHNRDERHSKELRRLADAGAVVYLGGGHWGPGPLLVRTSHIAQFFARHSEELP